MSWDFFYNSAASRKAVVGTILVSVLHATGSGYAAGDTGTINGGGGDATYVVDTVNAGAVVSYHLNKSGSGYSTVTGAATTRGGVQTGGGSGLTIDITTVA